MNIKLCCALRSPNWCQLPYVYHTRFMHDSSVLLTCLPSFSPGEGRFLGPTSPQGRVRAARETIHAQQVSSKQHAGTRATVVDKRRRPSPLIGKFIATLTHIDRHPSFRRGNFLTESRMQIFVKTLRAKHLPLTVVLSDKTEDVKRKVRRE